jgi:hypothetical protein
MLVETATGRIVSLGRWTFPHAGLQKSNQQRDLKPEGVG